MTDQPQWRRRWAEAIAQNVVASVIYTLLGLAWAALVLFLATHGGNTLVVRVWWLIVGIAIVTALVGWLISIEARIRKGTASGSTRPAAPHPQRQILDRIDGLLSALNGHEPALGVDPALARQYNAIRTDALAIDARVDQAVPYDLGSYANVSSLSAATMVGGLRQMRAFVEHVRPERVLKSASGSR